MKLIQNWKTWLVFLVIFIALLLGIYFNPILTGDDWETFHDVARIFLSVSNNMVNQNPLVESSF